MTRLSFSIALSSWWVSERFFFSRGEKKGDVGRDTRGAVQNSRERDISWRNMQSGSDVPGGG